MAKRKRSKKRIVESTAAPENFYKKKKTTGQKVSKFTAQASGAALGFVAGDIPGAIIGYNHAGTAYDYFNPDVYYKKTMPTNGTYAGRFKGKKQKTGLLGVCKMKGFQVTTEHYGKVADPDAVMIKSGTFATEQYAITVVGAILRKLFARGGIPLNDSRLELPLFAWDNSSGFRIEFEFITPLSSSVSVETLDIADNKSLENLVADLTPVRFRLLQYWLGASDIYLRRVFLYAHDNTITSVNYRLCALLNMENEEIHLHTQVALTVQNRTAAAEAVEGNLDLDRIDTQPLEVNIYDFDQGAPVAKVTRFGFNDQLNSGPKIGIRLIRVAEFADNAVALQNAPDRRIWKNCSGHTKTILQPGQMKKTFIKKDYVMKFKTFMSTLRVDGSLGENMYKVSGKCQLLHFSEALRTPSVNKVTCYYERRHDIGCYLVSKKQAAPFISSLTITPLNDE